MRALVIEPFPTTKGIIPAGQIIEISPALLEKLNGKVEAISSPQAPEAWLTETGELRTRGVIDDLAAVIVGLTADNLPLQRELLARHCEEYDRHHIGRLWDLWEERAAVMEHDGGLSRHDAECRAAERLHLLAFLVIRADARSGN
ncbi:hypothetical protein [Geobacter sp.]|uniref:hypothetical protein n=1 Tax=Geobacter sp. TaxID=46610 RepID=UPI0026119BB5|nr:hypothetical protein [Geobacter sp.]